MRVIIEPDKTQVAALEAFLGDMPGKMLIAGRDAINNSMKHGKAVATTDTSEAMGASHNSVGKRINLFKATLADPTASIYVRGGLGVNLYGFAARQTKLGVSAKIYGERRQFLHAFITRGIKGKASDFTFVGAQGAKIVAQREGGKRVMTMGRYAGRIITRGPQKGKPLTRQPFVSLKGPTVAEEFARTPGIQDHTTAEIEKSLPANINSQIDRFLK